MGHKLTDGNAAIADLSDSNRPNKIGDRYGELYDNQWTDAYEIFSKEYDEKKTVAKLIQILVVSFSFFFSIIVLFSSEQASVVFFKSNRNHNTHKCYACKFSHIDVYLNLGLRFQIK